VDSWRRTGSERLQHCRVFDVDRARFEPRPGDPSRDYFVVRAPDWINVIPLTDDDRVVMVHQYRVGIEEMTLEIPGGMCDGDEPPAEAARRELREETGYDASEVLPLGWVHPNPAIQDNRCHTYLARGAFVAGEPEPDGDEDLEVELVPLADVPRLIAAGRITHSLVIAAFHLLGLRPSR
jgi:8-oxo-dGTP pyrophosphatase MutT (NUDIX family)